MTRMGFVGAALLCLSLFETNSFFRTVDAGFMAEDVASDSEVPYPVGYVMKLDDSEPTPGYEDCMGSEDEAITSFCGGGMISEGVFLTAAHCFEEDEAEKASKGTLKLSNLRVGLGMKYPYRNSDGTCSGTKRGTAEGIYKIKAVYVHKGFKSISSDYSYSNSKTGESVRVTFSLTCFPSR